MGTSQPPTIADILPVLIETPFCVAWDLNLKAFGSWLLSWLVAGWSGADHSFSKEGLFPSEVTASLLLWQLNLIIIGNSGIVPPLFSCS